MSINNSKRSNHLLLGIIIGASAGLIAGIILFNTKKGKADNIKAKISNLAADAQERINALKAMAAEHETKKTEKN